MSKAVIIRFFPKFKNDDIISAKLLFLCVRFGGERGGLHKEYVLYARNLQSLISHILIVGSSVFKYFYLISLKEIFRSGVHFASLA